MSEDVTMSEMLDTVHQLARATRENVDATNGAIEAVIGAVQRLEARIIKLEKQDEYKSTDGKTP